MVDPFSYGVLKREVHQRLVDDMQHFAATARIPVEYIYKPLADYVGEAELHWVRAYREPVSGAGAYYAGRGTPQVQIRMMAMAGAFVRNFVDARVLTLKSLLELEEVSGSVLMVPDFFLSKDAVPPKWQLSKLLGILFDGLSAGRKFVLYISDSDQMGQCYGAAVLDFIQGNYTALS